MGGDRHQDVYTDIHLSTLDLSDVLVLIPNQLGKLLLRHAAKLAKLFDPLADSQPDRPYVVFHPGLNYLATPDDSLPRIDPVNYLNRIYMG